MQIEVKNIRKYSIGRNGITQMDMKNVPIPANSGFRRDDGSPGAYSEENYRRRIKDREKAIKEKCRNSFTPNTAVHIVLTFDKKKCEGIDVTDLSQSHNLFHLFVKRVNRLYDGFCYVATFARQENNNWHYHLMCNLPARGKDYIQEVDRIWQYGIVDVIIIKTYKHFDNCVKYLKKNMKEAEKELNGERGYLSSRNAKRNIVISSARAKDEATFPQFDAKAHRLEMKTIYSVRNRRVGIIKDIIKGNAVKEFFRDPQGIIERSNGGYKPLLMDLKISYLSVKQNCRFPEPKIAQKKIKPPSKTSKIKAKKPQKKQSPNSPPNPANEMQKSNSQNKSNKSNKTNAGIKSTKEGSEG